ncbi:MAG: hypothetical protein DRP62_05285 [Planctomycetota bacterium]|nr:MAG: hypothetical protein DRP62_05285 [Planctomycetota bacterium]
MKNEINQLIMPYGKITFNFAINSAGQIIVEKAPSYFYIDRAKVAKEIEEFLADIDHWKKHGTAPFDGEIVEGFDDGKMCLQYQGKIYHRVYRDN